MHSRVQSFKFVPGQAEPSASSEMGGRSKEAFHERTKWIVKGTNWSQNLLHLQTALCYDQKAKIEILFGIFFFPNKGDFKKKKKSLFLYLVYMALCMHSLQVVVVWCTLPYCIEYSRTISLFYPKDVQKMKVKSLSRVQFFTNPRTVVCQAPPSMGFSRQEYWSGVPFPSPGCPEASVKAVVL